MRKIFLPTGISLFMLLWLAPSFMPLHADQRTKVSAEVKARYNVFLPQANTQKIEMAPIPGFYQLVHRNTVYYMKEDASYMFAGDLYDAKGFDKLSEKPLRRERLKIMATMKDSLITYDSKNRHRGTAYVFTDIDCGYCRRFHANMKVMNEIGIRVHYVLTPLRSPQSLLKAVAVQCADNKNYAMDIAKSGGNVPLKQCSNQVEDNVTTALSIGMTGTPAILLETGELVSGYLEPYPLLDKIEGSD